MTIGLILLLALAIILPILFYPAWRERRILRQPFPEEWRAILRRRLPILRGLTADERERLFALLRFFLADKAFYGCDGLVVDDEIRLTIAAQACLLCLGRSGPLYPRLRHILVYPQAFHARHHGIRADGTVDEVGEDRLGESWDHGKVILSWDDVALDAEDWSDGFNVVLHEFAHQLDSENGETDGNPPLSRNRRERWEQVMGEEFRALGRASERGEETLLDPYGASHPAEFFAVATEAFFELPAELAAEHPRLFRELRQFYALDPRRWQA